MNTKLLYLFTRTPLHVGAGASVGAIDQPVQRERHTRYPIIPGSSIKGVLRDHFERDPETKSAITDLFGKGNEDGDKDFHAGKISFGEAHLILFPVRSAKGSYALATSRLALDRLKRETGLPLTVPSEPEDHHCLAGDRIVIMPAQKGGKAVVLEEYRFEVDGAFPSEWAEHLSTVLDDAVLRGAHARFVLLSDGDFSHFAENACQVSQHVRIDDKTGTAEDGGLFNEETVPSEALFASVLAELRPPENGNPVFKKLEREQLVQFGGSGTTGLGFCTTKLV